MIKMTMLIQQHTIRQPKPVGACAYGAGIKPSYLPLYLSKVVAGFPSPADDHVEKELSPTDYLVENKAATFFMRMQGNAMTGIGILDKDILVIDRSRTASIGDIVVASLDGEFLARILGRTKSGDPCLIPSNEGCALIEIGAERQFEIWGVVTGSMRRFR